MNNNKNNNNNNILFNFSLGSIKFKFSISFIYSNIILFFSLLLKTKFRNFLNNLIYQILQ